MRSSRKAFGCPSERRPTPGRTGPSSSRSIPRPYVYEGGVSEAEFEFASDGSLLSVGRNEAGDSLRGFGSVVCQTPPDAPSEWSCSGDQRKFDSPLMFCAHGHG